MEGDNLTITALRALGLLLEIIQWSIVIRAILSWFSIPKNNIFVKFILQLTEPILSPIRNLLENTSFGRNSMVDFSPIIAFLILMIISGFINNMIMI
ncbi:MAG TPA: YggT family protein [Acetivibrio sp.]|uniref:YggT family protein n=1 Tax=Acetivibrio sp. TaxID=1872092 RepID=UPI002CBD5388|nr:YggT family protein [Acetivibrio sp.]HOM01391.1 YggT family protein [Acetivibrio sp.]